MRVNRPARGGTSVLSTTNNYEEATGRLWKVQPAEHAATLYDHDAFGDVITTAFDVEDDDEIIADSDDRISKSDTTIEEIGGEWWRVTGSSPSVGKPFFAKRLRNLRFLLLSCAALDIVRDRGLRRSLTSLTASSIVRRIVSMFE